LTKSYNSAKKIVDKILQLITQPDVNLVKWLKRTTNNNGTSIKLNCQLVHRKIYLIGYVV